MIANINELTDVLIANIDGLMTKRVPVKTAEAVANTAGKILSAQSVLLKYHQARNEVPELLFLERNKKNQ